MKKLTYITTIIDDKEIYNIFRETYKKGGKEVNDYYFSHFHNNVFVCESARFSTLDEIMLEQLSYKMYYTNS